MRALILTSVVMVAGLAALAVVFPPLRHPVQLVSLLRDEPQAWMPVPVEGVRQRALRDSWGAPRSGGRVHQGIDIFAPRGTPVLSATRGIVVEVGTSRLGGKIVRVMGPGLEWHYYAHLDSYGRFQAGDFVEAGDVLGHVGDTGNARGTPPHLHYGVYGPSGRAQNPFPRLVAPRG